MKSALQLLLGLLAILPARGHFEATPFPKVVQPGVPLRSLVSADPHAFVVYKVIVPESTVRLNVISSGGTGNVDLFVRKGAHPTYNGNDTDYRSTYPGTRQQIRVQEPEPGVWYVGMQADGGYSGVQLHVLAARKKGALPFPVFSPPPGIYPGNVACTIKARAKKSVTRFTTDGEDPDAESPPVSGVLQITGETTVKARVFNAAGTAGPVAEALYRVRPADDVIDLVNTRSISHLASAKGGRHLFRITVNEGERLSVQTEGGKGKSMISVLHGAEPPAGKPVRGEATVRHVSRVVIPQTAAGDYYIALDGKTAYSGRTIMAAVAGDGPDLLPWADALRPYVSTEEFSETSCEVIEGLIGAGPRRLLRYSTEVRNIGAQDIVMPDPEDNPFFEYHDCHGHYHFKGFAASRLLDSEGVEVRTSRKVSFCLLDNIRWDKGATVRRRFNCSSQGIQAGWGDVYDSGLPGQWIEIGDLPAGDYELELTVNPDGILPEYNYENNTVRIPVTIPEE